MSLRVGTNDLAKARAFYDATFGVLGVPADSTPPEYGIALYPISNGVRFIVGGTLDGARRRTPTAGPSGWSRPTPKRSTPGTPPGSPTAGAMKAA